MNSITVFSTGLLAVSLLTNLTVQGLKSLLDGKEIKYSANIITAIVAVILAVVISACYLIYTEMVITPQIIIEIIALTYLSFLSATVGYDKVIQTLKQLGGK